MCLGHCVFQDDILRSINQHSNPAPQKNARHSAKPPPILSQDQCKRLDFLLTIISGKLLRHYIGEAIKLAGRHRPNKLGLHATCQPYHCRFGGNLSWVNIRDHIHTAQSRSNICCFATVFSQDHSKNRNLRATQNSWNIALVIGRCKEGRREYGG